MVHGDYLDVVGTIVQDIITLKYESSDDVEWSKQVFTDMCDWYTAAFQQGLVEVSYKYGEMLGYASWIRLHEIPRRQHRDNFVYSKSFKEGNVVYILDSCVRDDGIRHGTLLKLWHMVKNKNKDCTYFCWHQGKKNELKLYENVKEHKHEKVGV